MATQKDFRVKNGIIVGDSADISNDLTVNSNTLYVDSASGRVGIGTTSPSGALDVSGSLNVSGTVDGRDVSADGSKLDTIETSAKDDQTITAGSGLSGGGTGDVTLNHADTSSQGSVSNSGGTVIQDVSVDSFGHVTSVGSKSLDAADVGALGVNDKADDSELLDGLNSTQFLRSDTSDTLNGQLHVFESSSNIVAFFESGDSRSYISLSDNNSSSQSMVLIGANGDELLLRAGGSESARIDSDGNVAIGRSAASEQLHVQGNIRTESQFHAEATALAGNPGYSFRADTDTGLFRATVNEIGFAVGGSEAARIDSSGNVGIGTTSPTHKLEVSGSFAATTKSFVIPHPTRPNKKLQYGSLEGPENGVYLRGKVTDPNSAIHFPEYWAALVDPDSITVQLTPIGKYQEVYVKDVQDNRVVVGGLGEGYSCFYVIFAERVDVKKLEVEITD